MLADLECTCQNCHVNNLKKGKRHTFLSLHRNLHKLNLLPSLVYPVEVLHHLLGSNGEQHILAAAAVTAAAAAACNKQAVKKSLDRQHASEPASKYHKKNNEHTRNTTNKFLPFRAV